MRIVGDFFQDAGNLKVCHCPTPIHGERFADSVCSSQIFQGVFPRKDHRLGLRKRGFGVAAFQRKIEYFEDGIIGNDQLLLVEYASAVFDGQFIPVHTDVVCDFRIIIDQSRAKRSARTRSLGMYVSEVNFTLDPIYPVGIGVETVIVHFILNPKPYHKAGSQSDGQAGQINHRIQFIAKHVPQCDF